jgi:4-amino-4-deoxy-L-arabinose transferase-like glycosyltransferase
MTPTIRIHSRTLLPLVSIAALAAAMRLALVALWPAAQTPLVFEYEEIALNVLSGRGFQWGHLGIDYQSMRPLFPYLCAVVYALTGTSHVAMLVVQALTSGATAAATYGLGRALDIRPVGFVAGLAVALEPALLYYDVTRIHPIGLQALLFTLTLGGLVALLETPRPALAAAIGLVAGIAAYERGTIVFFIPVALVLVARYHRLSLRRALGLTAIVALVAVAVHVPWIVRNQLVYGRFVAIMTPGPELLWIGNNPRATGSAVDAEGRPMFERAPAALRNDVLGARDEFTQQARFRDEVRRYLDEKPAEAAALYAHKVFYSWWFTPQAGTMHPAAWFSLYKVVYALTLVAALWGLARGLVGPARSAVIMVAAFLVIVPLVQSAFFVEGRHRLAVTPALLALGAVGVLDAVTRAFALAGRRRRAAYVVSGNG